MRDLAYHYSQSDQGNVSSVGGREKNSLQFAHGVVWLLTQALALSSWFVAESEEGETVNQIRTCENSPSISALAFNSRGVV